MKLQATSVSVSGGRVKALKDDQSIAGT